jgi:hypothetical protein
MSGHPIPRPTAWSISTASSASASSRASRARSIRSSTWATDKRVNRCAGFVGSAGAWCCQPGCPCLIPGPERRFDLPMESSLRPRYDNSGFPRLGARQRATGLTPLGSVMCITLLRVWRSLTDADGQLRTPADTGTPALACGPCLRQADTGYTVDAGADRVLPKVPG